MERDKLIKELPGLVEERAFVLPFYKGDNVQRLLLQLGLIVYNLLSGKWRRNKCTLSEMATRAPLITSAKLKGGFLINDAVTDDARLVLRVLQEAAKKGTSAVNYCKAESLVKKGNLTCGVQVRDCIGGDRFNIRAKLVVNATGAWADCLRNQVNQKNNKHIRPLRGSHIILSSKKLPLSDNILLIHPEDGRPVIILAWEGRILMGTTDSDHENGITSEPVISKQEIRYLLHALNNLFPDLQLTGRDVISTMAGIRPVVGSGKKDPSKEPRDHVIWLEDGLLTVTGGKLTTFHAIALDVLDKAQEVLGKLPGLRQKQMVFTETAKRKSAQLQYLPEAVLKRLYGRYGNEANTLIADSSIKDLQPIPEIETLWAELTWTAGNEMVVHLDDLMLRRTRIGLLLENGGEEVLPKIRHACQPILGWSDQQWEEEEKRYLSIWNNYYSLPG
jgi:glycerol-3-phosphate dehydrogenase